MAVYIVSSIIFFLLFIILSLFVDGNVFAAQMEHRKLGGAKETMTTRRNLGENDSNKIGAGGSRSQHAGQKNTDKEPSQTHPDQATAQGQKHYLTYKALQSNSTCSNNKYSDCIGRPKLKSGDPHGRYKRGPGN